MGEQRTRRGWKRRLATLHAALLAFVMLIGMLPMEAGAATGPVVTLSVGTPTSDSVSVSGTYVYYNYNYANFAYIECEGVCAPTSEDDSYVSGNVSGESFNGTIQDLLPGTRYAVRAEVYDGEVYLYSPVQYFVTADAAVTTKVLTVDPHVVYSTQAVVGLDYHESLVELIANNGILVSTENDEDELKWVSGNGVGDGVTFITPEPSSLGGGRNYYRVSDLTAETTYYYRAFVRDDSNELHYGEIKSFTTKRAPTITTASDHYEQRVNTPIEFSVTVADPDFDPDFIPGYRSVPEPITSGFEIVENDDNIIASDDIELCTDEDGVPTSVTVTPAANRSGAAEISIWYERVGVRVSTNIFLEWDFEKPVVVTKNPSNLATDRAELNLELTDDGGGAISRMGWLLATDADDLLELNMDSWTAELDAEPNVSLYSYQLTNLTPGTTYYYRAFAVNPAGIGYGEVKSFVAKLAPSISAIPDQVIRMNGTAGPLTYTLSDPQYDHDVNYDYNAIQVGISIVNEGSVDVLDDVSLEYSQEISEDVATRTFTISPIKDRTGTATVTLSFENADREVARTSFKVTVNPPEPTPSTPSTPATSTNQVKIIVTDPSHGGTTVQQPITSSIGSKLELTGEVLSADGKSLNLADLHIGADGSMTMPNVPAGEYKILLYVIAPTGEKLAGQTAKLTIDQAGNATLEAELIDPYGIITNKYTGESISDVKVTLHWSDTELNRSKGRKPGELVILPILPDFAPNQNKDPQYSDSTGSYAWMVFPDGDYYILAEREGYEPFDSRNDPRDEVQGDDSYIRNGIIHVGVSIVNYDFTLTPIPVDEGTHQPYMNGYPDGSFRPDRGISRAEMAAILGRLFPIDASKSSSVQYADVKTSHWAAKDISIATQQGWMNGYAADTFKPDRLLTRAEFAQILFNVYNWEPVSSTSYTDLSGHWAEKAIAAAERQGAIGTLAAGAFHPNQTITRSETVTIMNKLLNRHPIAVNSRIRWTDTPESRADFKDIMEASVIHHYLRFEDGIEVWAE